MIVWVQVPIVGKDKGSRNVFQYFVSVQEQYLRQKDAFAMWKKEEERNTKSRKSATVSKGALNGKVQQDEQGMFLQEERETQRWDLEEWAEKVG